MEGPAGISGGTCLEAEHRSSVGPAAGFQVRSFAGGEHPRMVWLRKRPLVAPPIGPSTVPFADVTVQNVLDVLHNQVDGNCGRQEWLVHLFPPQQQSQPKGCGCSLAAPAPARCGTRPGNPVGYICGTKSQQTKTHVRARAQSNLLAWSARVSANLEPS